MDYVHNLSDALPVTTTTTTQQQIKPTLHIEVSQLPNSIARPNEIEAEVTRYLGEAPLSGGAVFTEFPSQYEFLTSNVAAVQVCENDDYENNNRYVRFERRLKMSESIIFHF